MEKRTIIDGGGCERNMELVYSHDGTNIYQECGTPVVCAFFDGDDLDASGNWFETIEQFVESRPVHERGEYDELLSQFRANTIK